MQTNPIRTQTQSSLVQFVKSLFQGKPAQASPVYTHPTYLASLQRNKCTTINVSDLSPEAQSSFDSLFANLFPKTA